jgi:iron complex outermembrane receptor protein
MVRAPKQRNLAIISVLALSSGIALMGALPAVAQEADADEEIVVTGRQRAESIQDVPLAITAFSETFIESSIPDTISDFQKFTPNVILSNVNFAGNALAASFRGVSFADLEKTFEPAIGTSIDGVFLATSTSAAFDVFDVESIEILRGPQGTLAGRNTIGGTVSVRRTRPTGELGARIGARFANNNARDYQLVLNSPSFASDQLAAKAFAFYRENDLFATNLARPSDQDDGLAVFSGGVTLAYDHAPGGFNALATLEVVTDRSRFVGPVNLTRPAAESGASAPTFCDLGRILFASQAACGVSSIAAAEAGIETYRSPIPFRSYIDGAAFTGEMNWEFDNGATLTAITGWRDTDELLSEENTGSPGFFGGAVPLFIAVRVQEFSQFSQELRLALQPTENIGLVTGLYYLSSDYSIAPGSLPGEITGPPTRAQSFAFGAPAQIFTAGQELTSWAAYAEAVVELAPQWELTIGGRYTMEEKDFRLNSQFQGNTPGTNTPDPRGIFNFKGSESWDALTGRVILDWSPSENVLVYGGWSRGFRSGGWNGRATRLAAVGPYDPEYVDSFEFGMRTDLFDRRLRFNPTIFYASYTDQQAEIIRPAVGTGGTETVVENAASATIQGVELEIQWAVTDNFQLRGAFGVLSAEYDEFFVRDPVTGVRTDVADQRLIRRAPEATASVVGDYTWPLGNGGLLIAQGSYAWTDEYSTGLVRDRLGRHLIDAYGQADLSLTYEQELSSGNSFRITGFAKDAFAEDDARIVSTLDAGVFYFGVPAQTRSYGVELSAEF